jgi:hypothetical protein
MVVGSVAGMPRDDNSEVIIASLHRDAGSPAEGLA